MAKRVETTDAQLQKRAEQWSREDLLQIWESVKAKQPIPGWDRGRAFEYLVVQAFRLAGAEVKWPYRVLIDHSVGTIEQLDGAVYLDERGFLVESKDLSEPAAIEAIAKMRFRLERRPPGTMGLIFSVSDFSRVAELLAQFASPMNILLWNRSDVDAALRATKLDAMVHGLRLKMAWATEHGRPLYGIEGEV